MGIVKEKLPRILFIMHMPPPVHGAAMVGKYIHDSRLVNEAFDCRYQLGYGSQLGGYRESTLGKIC